MKLLICITAITHVVSLTDINSCLTDLPAKWNMFVPPSSSDFMLLQTFTEKDVHLG